MAKRLSPDRLVGRIEQVFAEETNLHIPITKLMERLHIRRGDRTAFLLAVHGLEADGRLRQDTRGRYYRPTAGGQVRRRTAIGLVTALHTRFGFVTLEGERQDCFIPGGMLMGALPGDRVEVTLGRPDERGAQGRVTAILQPGVRQYTGCLYEDAHRLYVAPGGGFRYDLPVLRRSALQAEAAPGDMIRFEVVPSRSGDWMAQVIFCYGSGESARVCADALLDQYGIPTDFSPQALEEARQRAALPLVPEETRTDLRDWTIFTIDGADAKDLDDAISLQKTEDGWLLGVHIADVSYYVTPGSHLDAEALERGTSVYFADRVVPMLPQALSNGACSLNAGEEKRAFSALMALDEIGRVRDCRLTKSVIRSRVRGVYSEVNSLFDGTATLQVREKYRPVEEELFALRRLAETMKQAALRRGVIQLESTESCILLDEQGQAAEVLPRPVGEAEQLIEQCMILANTAVAALARKQALPFLYRIHETPNEERLGRLFELAAARTLPVPAKTEGVTPYALQKLVQAAAETPYGRLISDQLLRCMAKARYDARPVGHYGLALADYCHFTSPIRRYPDLMIHRILSRWLAGEKAERLHQKLDSMVAQMADSTSFAEQRAQSAERSCEGCYKAEYMRRFLGEKLEGMVVSVTGTGLFVELENTVTGLVPVESLPDPFLEYDGMVSLVDTLGRLRYTVGQRISVQVVACDVPAGRVRFSFCGMID